MKETAKLIIVPTLICLVAGLLLAAVNEFTAGPIAGKQKEEKLAALNAVLPEHDNDPYANRCTVTSDGREFVFYVARAHGAFAGVAFEAASPGYGADIAVMVGVNADDTVRAVEIVSADKETPGLGAKVKDAVFRSQFGKRSATDVGWCHVRKDGGEIDAITGATISSRAASKAVRDGLAALAANRDKVCGGVDDGGGRQAQ